MVLARGGGGGVPNGYQMGPVMGADLDYMDVLVGHCFGIQMGPVTGLHGLHIALPHNAACLPITPLCVSVALLS